MRRQGLRHWFNDWCPNNGALIEIGIFYLARDDEPAGWMTVPVYDTANVLAVKDKMPTIAATVAPTFRLAAFISFFVDSIAESSHQFSWWERECTIYVG